MKSVLIIIIVLAFTITYLLVADSPAITLQLDQPGFENVYTWTGANTPVPLPNSRINKTGFYDAKFRYIFTQSDNFYGRVLHQDQQIEISWYNVDNSEAGRFTHDWESDIPLPRYFLNPARNQIFSYDIYNRLRFYDENGIIENEFPLFKKIVYNNENNSYCQFIEQKDLLLIGFKQVSPVSENEQGYNSFLSLVDLDGNELFAIQYPGWQLNGISASSSAEHFIIPLHKYERAGDKFFFRTIIMDNRGNILADLPLQHNKAIFNENGTLICFFKNEKAWLYDIKANRIIREYSIISTERIYLSGLFIDEKNLFVLQEGTVYKETSDWAYKNLALNLIDYTGERIQQKELDDISQFLPVVKFSRQNEQIFIGHRTGYRYYSINF